MVPYRWTLQTALAVGGLGGAPDSSWQIHGECWEGAFVCTESRKFDMGGHIGALAADKKDLYFVQSMISGYGWWLMWKISYQHEAPTIKPLTDGTFLHAREMQPKDISRDSFQKPQKRRNATTPDQNVSFCLGDRRMNFMNVCSWSLTCLTVAWANRRFEFSTNTCAIQRRKCVESRRWCRSSSCASLCLFKFQFWVVFLIFKYCTSFGWMNLKKGYSTFWILAVISKPLHPQKPMGLGGKSRPTWLAHTFLLTFGGRYMP